MYIVLLDVLLIHMQCKHNFALVNQCVFDSLYCDIRFIVVFWNETLNIPEVGLSMSFSWVFPLKFQNCRKKVKE